MATAVIVWWYGLWFIPTTILFWVVMLNQLYKHRAAFISNRNEARSEALMVFAIGSIPIVREFMIAFIIFVGTYEMTRDIIKKVYRALNR